jgi:transposase
MREKKALSVKTPSRLVGELRDLARRREKLTDQVTALKSDMKRILSVTFPELEHVTGIFTKSTLRLLAEFPSAHALRQSSYAAIAAIVIPRSRGKKPRASIDAIIALATSSVGLASPAKELILKQEASLLLHVEEQAKETTKLLMNLCSEKMKKDGEILSSIKGIGQNTALTFLSEMGGDIGIYENDKKLIAAAGLDPSTYQSGKYEGKSRISKRGNRHLRRVIWIMATRVLVCNELFKTYFRKRRREGLPCKKAVLATAHKLIRVMYSMLIRKTCFVEGGIKYS